MDAIDQRIEKIDRRVDEICSRPMEINARDVSGFSALEGAVRNIVDHIENSEKQSRDMFNALQVKLNDVDARFEQAGSGKDRPEMIAQLEKRMQELAEQVERVGASDEQELKAMFESRLRELAERIDTVRHSAEATASQAAEEKARTIESRLSGLVEQVETNLKNAGTAGSNLEDIQSEIGKLADQFEEIRQQAASEQEVQALRSALEQLSSKVEGAPAGEPIAQIEERIAELSEQLRQIAQPQMKDLEQRIDALDSQLSIGKQSADDDARSRIGELEQRVSATEQQLASLATIENSIQQLFASLEDGREQAQALVETATDGAGTGSTAKSEELAALEMGLAAVRENAEAAEQRTQETLEAVHETLSQIITKLSLLDERQAEASQAGSTGTSSAAQLTDADEYRSDEARATMGNAGHAEPAATSQYDREPVSDAASTTGVQPDGIAGDIEGRTVTSEAWMSSEGAGEPLETAAPLPDSGGDDWLTVARSHMKVAHGGEAPIANNSDGQSPQSSDGHVDFIAAARRAAAAASSAPGVPSEGGSLPGFTRTPSRTDEDSAKNKLRSLLSRNPGGQSSGRNKSAEDGNSTMRKRLLMAGLVLLMAVSAYTINSRNSAREPEKQSSIDQTQPASKIKKAEALEGASTAGRAVAQLPAAVEPVEVPAVEPSPPEPDADPITTASIGRAEKSSQNLSAGEPVRDPLLSASMPVDQTEKLPSGIGTQALRTAALGGDPNAQFVIASRYLEGRLVGRDHAAAAHWYRRAANGGLAAAQYRIGTLYERGSGVEQDRLEAMGWYSKAAAQGNVKAMHNLAVLAADATSGQPDMQRAAKWFEAAAKLGLADSQYNFAVLSERGLGAAKNAEEAYKWYALAARQGDREAAKKQAALKKSLGHLAVERIDRDIASWQPEKAERTANMVSITDPAWGVNTARRQATAEPRQTLLNGREQIKQVQELLARKGFDPGAADGTMGSKTANAIRLYQLRHGLPVNGSVSKQLLEHLQQGII
jgi:localization factor PodJL